MDSARELDAKRVAYRVALAEALPRIVAHLKSLREVHRIVLFGSYAAGRSDLFTDLDIIVVMDSAPDFVTRPAALHPRLDAGVDLDGLVDTPDEFERRKGSPFLRRALETGRVIDERGSP